MMTALPPPKAFPVWLEHYFSLLLSSTTIISSVRSNMAVISSVHSNGIVDVVLLVLRLLF